MGWMNEIKMKLCISKYTFEKILMISARYVATRMMMVVTAIREKRKTGPTVKTITKLVVDMIH